MVEMLPCKILVIKFRGVLPSTLLQYLLVGRTLDSVKTSDSAQESGKQADRKHLVPNAAGLSGLKWGFETTPEVSKSK